MQAGILTDLTKCIGCKACVHACKEINGLPHTDDDTLSANTRTIIRQQKGVYIREQCRHCLEPTCASVCPVAALYKTETGAVTYDESKCIGCRYCVFACPFGIPKYEWEQPIPKVQKCVLCYEKRLSQGKEPACTSVCPTGATIFGNREELIQEARNRIRKTPGRYIDHIYGLKEAGGTSVMYLSSVPFEALGFKTNLHTESYPRLTWKVLSKIWNVVSVEGAFLMGAWWVINRRMKLQRKQHELSQVELEALDAEFKEQWDSPENHPE